MKEKGYSVRWASRLLRILRSVLRYKRKRAQGDKELRDDIRRLAFRYRRYEYRMITRKLRQEGKPVNHKRVYRIYREEGLLFRRKERKKKLSLVQVRMRLPKRENVCWSIDFMSDALTSGRAVRFLTALDDASRECLDLHARTSFSSRKVTERLDRVALFRGYPRFIRTDGGPEFQSKHFKAWLKRHGISHATIEPGKPYQNAYIESFNGTVREEFLNEHIFLSVQDANRKADSYKQEYNTERPHGVLGYPQYSMLRD